MQILPGFVVPIVAGVVLLACSVIRLWAGVTLMSRYRVADYIASAPARRLYWIGAAAPLVSVAAIVVLAFCSRLWWVEVPGFVLCLFVLAKTVWALRMRFTGKYVDFYRKHQWS
ncbi:MAG TPA: hypothetical protein VGF18_06330 [Candidatus Tumulicola sp.]